MLRRFFNLLGICLFAAAFITAVLDAQHSYTAAKLTLTPVGGAFATLAPEKWAAAQSFAGRYISLSNVIIAGFLRLPVWLPLCLAGAFLAWLGKRPRLKFGYSSR